MTDFHDVRVKIVVVTWGVGGEEAGFAGFAGVAHEEFAERPIAEHDDDAVFVYVLAGIGEERHRWREDVERDAIT
jgi:hypothetical protein